MSHNVVMRDIAYEHIHCQTMGRNIKDFFVNGDNVIIYGCGILGKDIHRLLCKFVNIVCFIDQKYSKYYGKHYQGIPVYSLEDVSAGSIKSYQSIKIIVTPMWAWENIKSNLIRLVPTADIIPVYSLYAYVERDILYYSNQTNKFLFKIIKGDKINIQHIMLAGTSYILLLYFLINSMDSINNTCFVFGRHFPVGLMDKMLEYGFIGFGTTRDLDNRDAFQNIVRLLAIRANDQAVRISGSDDMRESSYFINDAFTLLEDGYGNYQSKESRLRFKYVLDDDREYIPYGWDHMIKDVFLTGILPIPEALVGKSHIINIYKLWQDKSAQEKDMLLNLFSVPVEKIKKMISTGKDCILLTQHFSRSGYMSDKQQVSLYKKILDHYDIERIIIKPHPSDYIDYRKYFPEYCVLRENFPFEFFRLLDIKIQKVIAVNSTAMYQLDGISVEDYSYLLEEYTCHC